MIRRTGARTALRLVTVAALLLAGSLATATASSADVSVNALPTPLRFVSSLDLECFRVNQYQPPTTTILTRHLNPLLAGAPQEVNTLGPREQLCVPVAKNGVIPPPGVIDFIRFVDLSCYRIQGQPLNRPLTLSHLNPVVRAMGVPPNGVTVTIPQQLCVPVVKNGLFPPPEVRNLVQYIDLKCYVVLPQTTLGLPLTLSQLNPVLGNIPAAGVRVTTNRQLCLPVQKNNQVIPPDVLAIVRWIDLQKYDIVTNPLPVPVNLALTHINPSLTHLPVEQVTLFGALQLGLPVAKNNVIPPG